MMLKSAFAETAEFSCSKFTASDRSVPAAKFFICCPYASMKSEDTMYSVLLIVALVATSVS